MSHKVDDSIVTSKEESSLNLQFQQQTDVSDPRKRLPAVYSNPSLAGYLRPWRFLPAERSGTSKVTYAKTSRFEIRLDIQQLNRVEVRTEGGSIVVEGSQKPMQDKLGLVTRWMKRVYKIPPDVQLNTLEYTEQKAFLVLTAKRNLKDSLGENYYKIFPTLPTTSATSTPATTAAPSKSA